MHSYSIYTGISHVNQLTKLRPALIRKIRSELNEIAGRFGGRSFDSEVFVFPPALGAIARKTAEAAGAMYECLREHDRELYGSTVFVFRTSGTSNGGALDIESLLYLVPDDNGFWVADNVAEDFQDYFQLREEEGLFRVEAVKEAGLRLEERLPKLLVRPDRLPVVMRALENLDSEDTERTVLVIRGRFGSGKRATLAKALKKLYPDDGGSPLVIPFAEDSEDPMEPFIRALNRPFAGIPEYLDEAEAAWWEKEGVELLEMSQKGRIWETSRDEGPIDLIQAFALYVKSHVERRRQAGRPAYLLVDGFYPESEAAYWLRSLVGEFLGRESFRLILVRDSDDFDEPMPLPGKGQEVLFRKPTLEEWTTMVRDASTSNGPVWSEQEIESLSETCGASLYRLFHRILARENGKDDSDMDPGEVLVASLNSDARRLLFLAHVASGLANRRFLIERYGEDGEKHQKEGALYEGLIDYGLIREDPDGRVRSIPGGPTAFYNDFVNHREAERFGEYLWERYRAGDAVDLFRLFRYLERWGPMNRGIAVLDRLLESLMTNRRLRMAGILLNGPPMSLSDLDGPNMEALQNVVGAARLRYVLLTGNAEGARKLVRDGTVSLVAGRGAYSDRFRLHNARYSYALGRWDDALVASKDALFTFQKAGDHEGETNSHLELALALLATGKTRDALEHFGIAARIGSQVSASWGVLRAVAMETVAQFLFGNLSRALRNCREYRMLSQKEGRRDLWLLLTLVEVRIQWELGHYIEGGETADEGGRIAHFYGLGDEEHVMGLWKGRCLLASGNPDGLRIFDETADLDEQCRREAEAFAAEAAWMAGDVSAARRHITAASILNRTSRRLQGEVDDWSDGFFPIEGRLSNIDGPLDSLGEWIEGFDAYLAALDGDDHQVDRLLGLLEKGGRRIPRPFSYLYAYWASVITPEEDRESRTRYMSWAFNDLQARAGRFDDNQTKHAWLTANPWNRRLMEEAQRLKFL